VEEAGTLVRFVCPTCLREQIATHVTVRWFKTLNYYKPT